jgi:hypothetical protein
LKAGTLMLADVLGRDDDHGNSRLMSSQVERPGVGGSIGARRAT